jgi:hypothetical protein
MVSALVSAGIEGGYLGELTALTIAQIDTAAWVIAVDRKVIEVAGHLHLEAPKNRKRRRTIYPRITPTGYPLAGRLAARIEQARAEQDAGANPLGLIFPSPTGKHWRSSNFNRNVLQRAYLAAGWHAPDGNGDWTWHSLRHVFCTTPCSPGNSTPPTSLAWPATPTTASPWTCTSAPPPASWTAPAPPPNKHRCTVPIHQFWPQLDQESLEPDKLNQGPGIAHQRPPEPVEPPSGPSTGCNELSLRFRGGPPGCSRPHHGAHAYAPAHGS